MTSVELVAGFANMWRQILAGGRSIHNPPFDSRRDAAYAVT